MWDGIENAGWGTHDPNATVWKDLVGSSDLTLYGLVRNDHIEAQTTAAAESDFVIDGIETCEVCFGFSRFSSAFRQGLVFYSGVIDKSRLGVVAYGPSVGVQSLSDKFWDYPAIETQNIKRTISATKTTAYVNSMPLNSVSYPVDTWNNKVHTGIGGRQWQNGWFTFGDYYNVRIYSRTLTADEIAYNYNIDKVRFNLP